jgi:hypothetical protein
MAFARPNGNAARNPRLPCPGDDAQPCFGGGYGAHLVLKRIKDEAIANLELVATLEARQGRQDGFFQSIYSDIFIDLSYNTTLESAFQLSSIYILHQYY